MVPEQFKNYIAEDKGSVGEIPVIDKLKLWFSMDEVKEDFAAFKAIMMYGYSGSEYWEKQGNDFKSVFETIEKSLKDKDKIDLVTLIKMYHHAFSKIIVDNHLKFYLITGELGFGAEKSAYFSMVPSSR